MSGRWRTRALAALAAPLLATAMVTSSAPAGAAAASCENWTGFLPPSPGDSDGLSGVSAASPCNVWAVGFSLNAASEQLLTLAEHWNGATWQVVPTPSPDGNSNFLRAVSAVSRTHVWAVGETGSQSLIVRWDGAAWKRVPSPNPGTDINDLSGVDVFSATGGWAVGQTSSGSGIMPLILRWNGNNWHQVAANILRSSELASVAAVSPSSAWAVGARNGEKATLIEHWNGRTWARVASPNPRSKVTEIGLDGVATTSASSAWAVGTYTTGGHQRTLIVRWTGRAWKQVPSPNPGSDATLLGVSATSASNAWAVGTYTIGGHNKSLILAWNGRTWRQVPSPSLGTTSELAGVTAVSASNIWAVGNVNSGGGGSRVLAAHCC
ncbi:MAG TPA: hypothetical protein VFI65_03895 [Streptosporangiaceae bacterium]|nr:hypothetical protein [Streptosporangiaceae bacterium]